MSAKAPQPRNWGTIKIERYPEYFSEIEDALRAKPNHELVIPLGDPEVAKSHRLKYYKFRRSLAQPQNDELRKMFLPRTLKFEVLVRNGDLVFRDTELIYDKYFAVALGREPLTQAAVPPGLQGLAEIEVQQNSRDATKTFNWDAYLDEAKKSSAKPTPELPPLDSKEQELREFFKRYPPIFRSILGPLASRPSYTVEGTSFGDWPKQWTEVQRELGEPWASIELHLTDRAAIFKWVDGRIPE